MSDKTYVFDNAEGGCNNGMMGLVASLCQNRGLDPNMVAAMMNNNRGNGGWGDSSAWWIIILLIFGWGGFGNGFGGGFGGRGNAQGLADLGNLVNNDAGRELIMQAIQGNANAISQLASTVHCDTNQLNAAIQNLSTQVCGLGNQIGLGQRDIIQSILQGNNALASQLCECCCGLKAQIADFKGDIALQMCQQTNAFQRDLNFVNSSVERGFASTNYAFAEQTCQLKNEIGALKQYVGDQFCALKERELLQENRNLRDQVQAYQLSASQQQQTANIVAQLQPVPRPAYLVANPYGCGCGNNYYPYNNGCGCNSNCNPCGGCGC